MRLVCANVFCARICLCVFCLYVYLFACSRLGGGLLSVDTLALKLRLQWHWLLLVLGLLQRLKRVVDFHRFTSLPTELS